MVMARDGYPFEVAAMVPVDKASAVAPQISVRAVRRFMISSHQRKGRLFVFDERVY